MSAARRAEAMSACAKTVREEQRALVSALPRSRYAALFGPTTGDRIRLADTDLLIEITEDRSGGPGLAGDEAVFGGGKVMRESMGQGRATRAEGAPDTVITGVVIIDHWGIIKADIGIRDGRIVAIGKAGNPDIMSGVHPDLVIGPSTEIIAGNGRIVTAGSDRLPRAPDLSADHGGGPRRRHHHAHRRRHRARRGQQGHHRHPGRLAPGPDAGGAGLLAGEHRAARQGQYRQRRVDVGAVARRRVGIQAARGLGIDAGRHRRVPDGGRGRRRAGGPAHRHPQRGGLRRGHAGGHRGPRRSTPTTPRAPAAGTHRTSSRWRRRPNVLPSRRPTRPGRTPSTPSTNTSTC